METTALISDGVGLEELDKMVKAHGMPVGPITLADEVRVKAYPLAPPRWPMR
jgi:3-hydroxyacyl-CoA dehydrogenase